MFSSLLPTQNKAMLQKTPLCAQTEGQHLQTEISCCTPQGDQELPVPDTYLISTRPQVSQKKTAVLLSCSFIPVQSFQGESVSVPALEQPSLSHAAASTRIFQCSSTQWTWNRGPREAEPSNRTFSKCIFISSSSQGITDTVHAKFK